MNNAAITHNKHMVQHFYSFVPKYFVYLIAFSNLFRINLSGKKTIKNGFLCALSIITDITPVLSLYLSICRSFCWRWSCLVFPFEILLINRSKIKALMVASSSLSVFIVQFRLWLLKSVTRRCDACREWARHTINILESSHLSTGGN